MTLGPSYAATALTLILPVAAVNADPVYRTIFLSGQQMPGFDADVRGDTQRIRSEPVVTINEAGEVLFSAVLRGPGITPDDDWSLWLAQANGMHLALRESDPAPGMPPGATYSSLNGFSNNVPGQITVRAAASGPNISSEGEMAIWSGPPDALNMVVRQGDSIPGTTLKFDLNFFLRAPRVTPTGLVSICDEFSGMSSLSNWTGDLHVVAARGLPAAAAGPEAAFFAVGCTSAPVNSRGQFAFDSSLTGPGVIPGTHVDPGNNRAIWSGQGSELRFVARTGSPAPGTGSRFSNVSDPRMNAGGDIAFSGSLFGTDDDSNRGVWLHAQGRTALVAREGDPAPGTSAFFGDLSATAVASDGRVVVRGMLTGAATHEGNDVGYWYGSPGAMKLLVREGDAAPGLGEGVFIDSFEEFSLRGMNRRGQALIYATLRGAGVDDANDEALWLTDTDQNLHLLARTGDPITVGPNDVRDILRIDLGYHMRFNNYGDDGNPMILNDHGEVATRLEVSGGNGIFVLSIPEPAALAVLAPAALLFTRRRGPRRIALNCPRTPPADQ